jgi:spore coat protein A
VVNGVMQPFLQIEPRRYRFRVLNGSNARQYELALSSGQPLIQIATEGSLLPAPVERSSLFITQAERYEFIADSGLVHRCVVPAPGVQRLAVVQAVPSHVALPR